MGSKAVIKNNAAALYIHGEGNREKVILCLIVLNNCPEIYGIAALIKGDLLNKPCNDIKLYGNGKLLIKLAFFTCDIGFIFT